MLMCIKPHPIFWIINIKPGFFHIFNLVPRKHMMSMFPFRFYTSV